MSVTSLPSEGVAGRAARTIRTLPLPLLYGLFFILLSGLCGWYLALAPLDTSEQFGLGAVSSVTASRFYTAETTDDGRGYRWTDGDARLRLLTRGFGAHALSLTLSAPRPEPATVPVTITVNGGPPLPLLQDGAPRRHLLLVSGAQVQLFSKNTVRIVSPTFRTGRGSDQRTLGVVAFEAGWQALEPQPWLVPLQALALAAAATALLLLLGLAGIPAPPALLVSAIFLAALVATRHSDARFIFRWNALLTTSALALALALLALVVRSRTPAEPLAHLRLWVARHWPALAGYTAITAVMLWPLTTHYATHIYSLPGDSFEYLWNMRWWADALTKQHVTPTFVPQLMYPEGFELAFSEMSPANSLLGVPMTLLFGPIVSLNTMVFASYILSGFFTYLLICRLGGRRLAAFAAGLAFAFALRRAFQQNAGHLNLLGTQWLPLALYGLEGLLTRRRTWDGLVAGLGLALAAWASWYYGTTFAIFMAGYALLRPGPRQLLPTLLGAWRPILVAGAVVVALLVPILQPYLEARDRGTALSHGLIHLEVHSSRPHEFLLTNTFHPIWGRWAAQFHRHEGGEHFVALGYMTMLLALGGIWAIRRRGSLLAALLGMALLFALLSLGPWLYLPNAQRLPLPALFIYEHVPFLGAIRVWNRISLYVVLCAAVLGGLGLSALPRRLYRPLVVLAGLALLAEAAARLSLSPLGPRPVDEWLATQPQGAVIQMPTGPSGTHAYYSLFHQKPVAMWHGTFEPPLYAENAGYAESRGPLRRFPEDVNIRLLQRWQISYIIVDEAVMNDSGWEETIAADPRLTLLWSGGGMRVYGLAHK